MAALQPLAFAGPINRQTQEAGCLFCCEVDCHVHFSFHVRLRILFNGDGSIEVASSSYDCNTRPLQFRRGGFPTPGRVLLLLLARGIG